VLKLISFSQKLTHKLVGMTADEAMKLSDETDADAIPIKNIGCLYALILVNLGKGMTLNQIPGWLFEYLMSKGVKTNTAKVVWLMIEAFKVKFPNVVVRRRYQIPQSNERAEKQGNLNV